jgi:hypothetical protein
MQVRWVQVDTHEFWKQTSDAMKSPEAAIEWLARFRETLLMSADNDNPLPYAESLVIEAQGYIGIKSIARIKGHVKKNSPDLTDEEIDEFCIKKYGKKYSNALEAIKNRKAIIENKNDNKTKSKSLSADGDTREGSQNVPDGSDAAFLETISSADTETLDGLTDKDERPVGGMATSKPSRTTPPQNSYGEFSNVKMTTAEFEKFVQAEGAERANALIEELSSYLASSGKRYKSHYATLLNWCRRKDTDASKGKKSFKQIERDERTNFFKDDSVVKKMMAEKMGEVG